MPTQKTFKLPTEDVTRLSLQIQTRLFYSSYSIGVLCVFLHKRMN